jgi:predicted phage terminase large subunit-like protein
MNADVPSLCRASLTAFGVLSKPGFSTPAHVGKIARALEAVERGEITRLIIELPPRHGKSTLVSELFPAWALGLRRGRQIILGTYNQEFAEDWGTKVRDLMDSPEYQFCFPGTRLRQDTRSKKRFASTTGGAYFAAGVDGALTGRGAHFLLIDDPYKNRRDADSSTYRRTTWDWFRSAAYTRLMPGRSAIVITHTRWRADDLIGQVLSELGHENWVRIRLPAIAEEGDDMGRLIGEALWPEHFTADDLARIQRTLGKRDWAALYQQRPVPEEGSVFKPEWFSRRYRMMPILADQIIQSWDTAFKKGDTTDFSVGTTWRTCEGRHHLADVYRKRLEYPELRRTVIAQALRWAPDLVLIEDKASGQSLIQDLQANTRLPVMATDGSNEAGKWDRAVSVSTMAEGGLIVLPEEAPWLAEYEEELFSFPTAEHDDQVDSTTQAWAYLRDRSTRIEIKTARHERIPESIARRF